MKTTYSGVFIIAKIPLEWIIWFKVQSNLYTTATLGTWGTGRLIQVAAYSLGPGSTLREKGEKKISVNKASWEVVWGGERVAEPGDMPLMPPIHPPAIDLSLKCQHIKLSSLMSAWACYVAFVKKYLNSRWSKSANKEIYLTSIANSPRKTF